MLLLIVYLALMITGDIAAYLAPQPRACRPSSRCISCFYGSPGSLRCGLRLRGRNPNRAGAEAIRTAGKVDGPSAEARAGPHRTGTWCGKKTY